MFDWENGISLNEMQGNWTKCHGDEKSHGFSRVAAGTWCIFLSYGGDGHSKLMFID